MKVIVRVRGESHSVIAEDLYYPFEIAGLTAEQAVDVKRTIESAHKIGRSDGLQEAARSISNALLATRQ